MITYKQSLSDIGPQDLQGFFVGWPHPPSPQTHLRILAGSFAVELAVNSETGRVIGFANAVSDGALSACIPLLEVLPQYQHQGIGSELVQRLLRRLEKFYMVDLVCDEHLQTFYGRLGMRPANAMVLRRYEFQAGASD